MPSQFELNTPCCSQIVFVYPFDNLHCAQCPLISPTSLSTLCESFTLISLALQIVLVLLVVVVCTYCPLVSSISSVEGLESWLTVADRARWNLKEKCPARIRPCLEIWYSWVLAKHVSVNFSSVQLGSKQTHHLMPFLCSFQM